MMPVLDIFFYSLIFLLPAALLLLYKKIKIFKFEWFGLMGGAFILTVLSFFIFKEKVGGTVLYRAHGWPHFFMNYQVKDILDNAIINKWHFTPGGLGSYLIADLIFYFSALLFLFILFKAYKRLSMKKIYLVLAAIILIALAVLYFKKFEFGLNNTANQPVREEQINLVISGNVVINNPGFKKDVWYLVYEEPGKPGLSLELKFDNKSVCNFLGENKPCSNLIAGDRVGIQGIKQNNILLVGTLNMNIFSER